VNSSWMVEMKECLRCFMWCKSTH